MTFLFYIRSISQQALVWALRLSLDLPNPISRPLPLDFPTTLTLMASFQVRGTENQILAVVKQFNYRMVHLVAEHC